MRLALPGPETSNCAAPIRPADYGLRPASVIEFPGLAMQSSINHHHAASEPMQLVQVPAALSRKRSTLQVDLPTQMCAPTRVPTIVEWNRLVDLFNI